MKTVKVVLANPPVVYSKTGTMDNDFKCKEFVFPGRLWKNRFFSPSSSVFCTKFALIGVVVSNPIAKNITFFSGFSRAILMQSSGLYSALMSQPSPRSFCRLVLEPGTLIISARVQRITPGIWASFIASSMRLLGITQTGQPGPWTKFICSPTSCGRPNFMIECVCPPQISMIFSGFTLSFFMSFESAKISSLSRKSLIRFTLFPLRLACLPPLA